MSENYTWGRVKDLVRKTKLRNQSRLALIPSRLKMSCPQLYMSGGGVAGGEDGAKRSAKQSSGEADGRSGGADGSSGGGRKCQSPGEVENISEASEMEEGEPDVGEDPMGVMVFGGSSGKPRGRDEEKRTSSENARLKCKADKERETEKRRASSTGGEVGKDIS
ncbi:hypothetical protein KUCAC02_024285 [Chaenocephalus aceratus]|uniref:Uncharacterized protein n=1 Tax=Chaenocephalus aceratus TaxID=36190 RepID=A0ACB9WJ05_CHAAC|nr:hypothetical protein KUCAC02_024285 [Chaenocephalus aceratus]